MSAWRQPRALYVLFFTELWERFGFFGMKVLLVLYLVREIGLSDQDAFAIYGAYTALIYLTPVAGGRLADALLGQRTAILLGSILMALGQLVTFVPHPHAIFVGMGLIIVGNGFLKANVAALLGRAYGQDDPRRDGGFTIFYVGINLGAILAATLCVAVAERFGYRYGFLLSALGTLLGLVVFVLGRGALGQLGLRPGGPQARAPSMFRMLGCCLVAALGASLLLHEKWLVDILLVTSACGVLGHLALVARREGSLEKIAAFSILMLFNVGFWACFEQAGSSLTLFADRHVDRIAFGVEIPAASILAINPMLIVALGPAFSWLWTALGRRGVDPSSPMKFALALFQLGLGFCLLALGIQGARDRGHVDVGFLVGLYLLHTTGELCLSPIGLSLATKLAPRGHEGLVMGAWWMSIAGANSVASVIAGLTGASAIHGLPTTTSLETYGRVYGHVGLVTIVLAVALAVVASRVQGLLAGSSSRQMRASVGD